MGVAFVVLCSLAALAAPALAAVPDVSKTFGASSVPFNGSTSLSISIGNPNGSLMTSVGFTDNLPAGLVVANPNGLINTCGGTAAPTPGSASAWPSRRTRPARSPGRSTPG